MTRIEIIKDGTMLYLITPEGVQMFDFYEWELPYDLERTLLRALEIREVSAE